MDILLVIPYSQSRTSFGPIGVACDTIEGFMKIQTQLSKNDMTLHILSTQGRDNKNQVGGDIDTSNIKFNFFNNIRPFSLTSDINYFLRMLKYCNSVDLVHSHDIYGGFCGACLLRMPMVFTLHGILWNERGYASDRYTKLVFDMELARFKRMSKHLKHLVAISPYVIDELKSVYGDISKVSLIENPVSDAFYDVKKEEDEGLILVPGVISYRKNQLSLIKAAELLRKGGTDVRVVFTGAVKDGIYYQGLKDYVRKHELEEYVSFAGQVPLPDLLNLYSRASVVALTSRQETAPMSISEAMATGTPVVASDLSGIPHMIEDNVSGFLIDPDDISQISEKIRVLTDDKKLRHRTGLLARDVAAKRWKNDIIAENLLNLYLRMADS
ncbi:glycosyltransferase family 4 protein [Methanoculleus bourgensis]|jgi:glycosyltransferase involved in cell wall biosynthesis|uniref:glycosyltransferase family 4 protein n=1 Tax=Methanoculleus bourgensis TaxID=83986 RepID=UPI001BDABB74|nr:glycosyltransferase family 4 protein [Methanoculleus bourgensis]MBT0733028.1 glycosyltransferase family 4 protein [Methanoculleus bourgensis]